MVKFKSLLKVLALMVFLGYGVSNSLAQGGVWGSGCPAGSFPNGQSCGYQVDAICPSGGWVYAGNENCQYMQTQKAVCPAGAVWYAPLGESGQCFYIVGPAPQRNPGSMGMMGNPEALNLNNQETWIERRYR